MNTTELLNKSQSQIVQLLTEGKSARTIHTELNIQVGLSTLSAYITQNNLRPEGVKGTRPSKSVWAKHRNNIIDWVASGMSHVEVHGRLHEDASIKSLTSYIHYYGLDPNHKPNKVKPKAVAKPKSSSINVVALHGKTIDAIYVKFLEQKYSQSELDQFKSLAKIAAGVAVVEEMK